MRYYNVAHVSNAMTWVPPAVQRWLNLASVTSHQETKFMIYSRIAELRVKK